jgi:3-hydroxyisobutyrate dehydrogenase-like beta-hydroxyacid dehydrogenase
MNLATTPDTPHTSVTVIGLGLMGRALASAFLAAGHSTTVWNRTPDRAEPLVHQGAIPAESVEDAVAASPLVVLCLTDYAAVHQLIDPLDDGVFSGRVLVNLTTGTSHEARATGDWAAQRGIDYLDGVIMAVPSDIGTDAPILFYSGSRSAFDTHENTLRAIAPKGTTYLGVDHGLSALHDMAVLTIMWAVLNGFLQGAALLEAAGVKASTFLPFAQSLIPVTSDYIAAYATQIEASEYPAVDATMTVHQRALEHLVTECKALGVSAELPALFKKFADRAVADGHADSEYSVLIEQFRRAGHTDVEAGE